MTDTAVYAPGNNPKQPKNILDRIAAWITPSRFAFVILLLLFLSLIVFPFYWMLNSSFKSRAEIGRREPTLVPESPQLDAYRELFDPEHPSFQNFFQNIINSFKVATGTSFVAVTLSILGAYAIARLRFKGKNFMLNTQCATFRPLPGHLNEEADDQVAG